MCRKKKHSMRTGVALNIGMALTLAVLPAKTAMSGGGNDYELTRALVAPGGGISSTFGAIYLP